MERKAKRRLERQQDIYDFLVQYITKNGFSPSMREICDGTDIKSTSSVYDYLCLLEMNGKIEVRYNTARAIRLVGYEFVKKKKA